MIIIYFYMLDNHLHLYAQIYPPPQSADFCLPPKFPPTPSHSIHPPNTTIIRPIIVSLCFSLNFRCLAKAMVFPVVMYGCESWTIKKVELQRIDACEPWCWRRLLRVPWTARRSNQSLLKEISLEYSLEGLMLKLKLHWKKTLLWPLDANNWLIGKDPDAGKD